jgi:YD repeat-containing protein
VSGYLESVLLSPRQEVRLTYSRQDLLLSQVTYSTGELTTYLYDSLGRLTATVLPTGNIFHPLPPGRLTEPQPGELWSIHAVV